MPAQQRQRCQELGLGAARSQMAVDPIELAHDDTRQFVLHAPRAQFGSSRRHRQPAKSHFGLAGRDLRPNRVVASDQHVFRTYQLPAVILLTVVSEIKTHGLAARSVNPVRFDRRVDIVGVPGGRYACPLLLPARVQIQYRGEGRFFMLRTRLESPFGDGRQCRQSLFL